MQFIHTIFTGEVLGVAPEFKDMLADEIPVAGERHNKDDKRGDEGGRFTGCSVSSSCNDQIFDKSNLRSKYVSISV